MPSQLRESGLRSRKYCSGILQPDSSAGNHFESLPGLGWSLSTACGVALLRLNVCTLHCEATSATFQDDPVRKQPYHETNLLPARDMAPMPTPADQSHKSLNQKKPLPRVWQRHATGPVQQLTKQVKMRLFKNRGQMREIGNQPLANSCWQSNYTQS